MRKLLISMITIGALAGSPALAADTKADPAKDDPTHEMCKAVMGRKMEPRQPHDHARDKTGMVTWPNGKPLTKAEMDKMHARCMDKMSKTDAPPPK